MCTMLSAADANLIEKVCWCYYVENLKQEDIAKRFGISRLKVVKLLELGRRNNIVTFQVNRKKGSRSELELALCKQYDLDDAYIVPTTLNEKDLSYVLAQALADYIKLRIAQDTVINIGYGKTISHFLNLLASKAEYSWSAVSLTGGVNCYLPDVTSEVFRTKLYLYPAPLLMSSKALTDEMQKQKDILWIKNLNSLATMSVVGLGGLNNDATVITNGLFDAQEFLYLKKKGAIGDILGHFINKDGQIVDEELDSRLISTSLDKLKSYPRTVGCAGGKNKIDIIKASMQAKFIKVLVSDEETVKALI